MLWSDKCLCSWFEARCGRKPAENHPNELGAVEGSSEEPWAISRRFVLARQPPGRAQHMLGTSWAGAREGHVSPCRGYDRRP